MAISLPVKQRTPAWLEARMHGIGASEAAAAIGLSEWQSPIGLWAAKLGLVPPPEQTPAMRIGTALEPLIAEMYTEATGVKIRRANNLRQHATHEFMLASIDRRAGRKPIELKYSARAVGYGDPGTDEVPDDVLVQVLHQLAVLDEPEGDVALLKPGAREVLIYSISRSTEAEARMIEREAIFWDHVQSRTEPPVDGSEATRAALAAMYPRGAELVTVDADPVTATAMLGLREARRQIDELEAERAELEAIVQAAMLAAGADRIVAPGIGEIPWKATKPRLTTDWQGVAGAYREVIERVFADAESFDIATVPFRLADSYEPFTREHLYAVVTEHTESKETKPRFGPAKWAQEES